MRLHIEYEQQAEYPLLRTEMGKLDWPPGMPGGAVAELGGEEDGRIEGLAGCVEETVDGRVVGGFGGCGAGGAHGAEFGDVAGDGVDGRHVAFHDCTGGLGDG